MPEISCDLNSCFLCSNCIPEWKEAIRVKKKTLLFKKTRQIFREGETVQGIFFIYEGSAKVFKQWTDQKELVLRFARTGDILGHRGLGGAEKYPISATALEDSKVCFINNEFLEASLKTNPFLTYKLMQFYATELQRAEKRMRDLAHMEVKGRIALALLDLARLFGHNDDQYIAVPVTRQDIASYAGTSYETVFKFFTELIRAGILTTSGKSIRINHADQLENLIKQQ